MKFVFRLDFGPLFGWGHLSRTLAFASALMAKGSQVVIATESHTDDHPTLNKFLASNLLEVHSIPNSNTQRGTHENPLLDFEREVQDAIETLRIGALVGADVIVLDHYGLGVKWIETVRTSFPVCLVSDFPAQTVVDYLVDYGFDATPQKHLRGMGSETKFMLGAAFAPIDSSYERFIRAPNDGGTELGRVLVSLGGLGKETLARQIVSSIYQASPDVEIHIAGEPSNYNALRADCISQKLTIARTEGLATEFERCQAAVVGAGLSMYELMASGYLGLVIQTAKNQELAFTAALRKGFVRGIQEPSLAKIKRKFAEEVASQSKARKLEWLRARSLVDHLGPSRFAMKLGVSSSFRPKLREVLITDLPFLLRLANQPSNRAGSLNSHIIEPLEHWDWGQGFFDGSKRGWIFGTDEVPLGHCSLDREESRLYLSYSIQEEFHGEGWGTTMLRTLFEQYLAEEKVFARVKAQNYASLKALSKVGFVPFQSKGGVETLVRET